MDVIGQRREAKQAAARTDRRQQPVGGLAGPSGDSLGRRLLEILEQRIGAAGLEIVYRSDHHARHGDMDGVVEKTGAEGPHLIDVDRAGEGPCPLPSPVAPGDQVGMAAGRDQPGGGMSSGNVEVRRVERARQRRQHPSTPACRRTEPCRRLSAGEQPGMVEPARFHAGAERGDRGFV